MKVLVGFDGSQGARDAVALAQLLNGVTRCKILLANVLPLDELLADPYRLLSSERFPASLEVFRAPLRALAGIEVETRSFTGGSPARVIYALAEDEDVELIVVGSPHRGALGRALIGSVAENLLHGSSRPLVVAPRGYASTDHGKVTLIAVAYDGTPEAKLALRQGEALAADAGARLRILTVAAPAVPMPGGVGYAPMVGFDPEALIEEALASVGPEVETESRRLVGAPAAALAEACENGVDLLVTGSRGYGPLSRVFAGSVCAKLIREATCPVLVVPRPERQERNAGSSVAQTREPKAQEGAGRR
jgi:nucleotide-binding universal stress UspA family protein